MINYKFWSDYKHTSSDEESINYLLTLLTSNPKEITLAGLDQVSQNTRLLLALDENHQIIGMASLALINIPTGKSGRIEDVVVDDKFRGQGIGTSLIKQLIAEAEKLHLKRIDLTSKPARIEANQMYQNIGFSKYETNVYRMKFEN